MAAGLGSMPGGGAEIFDPEVRTQICPRKADGKTWLDVHRTAHQLGLAFECLDALRAYRRHRASHRSSGATAATSGRDRRISGVRAAWRFIRKTRSLSIILHSGRRALVDLRVMAVSRLMLDNFEHIKAYWISLGVGTAQTALAYGADDLDGTVRHERIHHAAGAKTPEALTSTNFAR